MAMEWEQVSPGVSLPKGSKYPIAYKETDGKQYFYLCHIKDRNSDTVWLKCGTTCNPKERMTAHYREKGEVRVIWFSPVYTKYTALKIEDNFKDFYRNHMEWAYIRNDRFIIPEGITTVEVMVRKTYTISLV